MLTLPIAPKQSIIVAITLSHKANLCSPHLAITIHHVIQSRLREASPLPIVVPRVLNGIEDQSRRVRHGIGRVNKGSAIVGSDGIDVDFIVVAGPAIHETADHQVHDRRRIPRGADDDSMGFAARLVDGRALGNGDLGVHRRLPESLLTGPDDLFGMDHL